MSNAIVCDATPFCFGPAAALISIGRPLADQGFQLIAVATGSTAELLETEPLFDVITCASDVASRVKAIRRVSAEACCYLNIAAPETFRELSDLDMPKVYHDFLFFMFEPRFAGPEVGADLYLIENYPGAADRLSCYGHVVRNPLLVPPVLTAPPRLDSHQPESLLLVTMGGLESPLTHVGVNTRYPELMTEVIIEALSLLKCFDRTLVTGGRRAMEDLDRRFGSVAIHFRQLTHDSFLEQLSMASILLAHPGLYATAEAFAGQVPIVFLPPSNYTQVLQQRFYAGADVDLAGANWEELGILPASGNIQSGLPEERGVELVLECIDLYARSPDARRRLCELLVTSLRRAMAERSAIIPRQSAFLRSASALPMSAAVAIASMVGGRD